jgi:FKBP-type peptidyl-prolyl cis-trans isomerase SlyD
MKIRNGSLVFIHYTLTNDAGEVLDTSVGYEPLEYTQGNSELIAGLEAFLEGEDVGFAGKVSIPPAEGYGEYEPKLIIMAQRDNFPEDMDLAIGMQVQTELPDGLALFRVTEINDQGVTLDANHPLAGKTLHFDVEVIDVQSGALAGESGS